MAGKKAYRNKKNGAGPFFWTDDEAKRMKTKYPLAFERVPLAEATKEVKKEGGEKKEKKPKNQPEIEKSESGTSD